VISFTNRNNIPLIVMVVTALNFNLLKASLTFITGARALYFVIILCSFAIVIESINKKKFRLTKESIFLILWNLWIITTPLLFTFKIINQVYFVDTDIYRYIVICCIAFVSISCSNLDNTLRSISLGSFIGGVLYILLGLKYFSLSDLVNIGAVEVQIGSDENMNSNAFAYLLFLSIIGVILYYSIIRKRIDFMGITFFAITSLLIVLSGSRKTFLGLLVLLLLISMFFLDRKLRNHRNYLIAIIALILIIFSSYYILDNTLLGERLNDWIEQEKTVDIELEKRFAGRGRFYVEMLEVIRFAPLIGIGIGNFKYYDLYNYNSHSDIVSIISETGLVGGFFYIGVYFIILLRIQRRLRMQNSHTNLMSLYIIRSAIITILIIALGRWNYNHVPTYIFMAAFSSHSLEEE
jgi:O-antigen ligase